ncbi:hypothetical protein ACP70R_009584 [Stipagrostis hirtigluma subsp. patula]
MAAPPHDAGGEDLISDLPFEILSAIISRLATAEAARTAVLSTRWRDAWRGTPLRLDDLELPVPAPARARAAAPAPWASRADVITRALASHPGPVTRFRLSRTTLRARVPVAEAWFRELAAAKRAREVSLRCPPEWCHLALADPLLACPTLETLALGECRFSDAGAAAVSAARLTELSLSSTHLSEAALQSVLSGCPALRSVVLRHVQGPRRIRVSSCRNLVLLGVWKYKHLEELTVEDAPRLERLLGAVHLGVAITIVGAPKLTALGYLVVGLRRIIPNDESAHAQEKVGKGLCVPIHSVKILAISVAFSSKKDMEKVMGLLKCFPFLETLHIQGKHGEDEDDIVGSDYYQKLDPIRCVANNLKSVRLESKAENRNMLEFACFILANAQVLQIMRIQSAKPCFPASTTGQQNLLSQCHMASVEAKVMFQVMKDANRKEFSLEAVNALLILSTATSTSWATKLTLNSDGDYSSSKFRHFYIVVFWLSKSTL